MSAATPRRARRGNWLGAAAVSAVVAVVATLAVVWPGYDAQQTPLDDATVWAMQNGAGSGYARVNLELAELDTVKQVENGSSLAQSGERLFVFSDADTQFADVDMATPADLTAEAEDAFAPTPAGTTDIAAAGDYLAYLTETGAVYGATLSGAGRTVSVDPYADVEAEEGQERPRFVATAVAVDPTGILYAYSATEGRVIRADAATGSIVGEDATARSPADAQLTAVDGRWVLLDESTGGLLLRDRAEEVPTDAAGGAVLQQSAVTGSDVFIADTQGLIQVPLDSLSPARVHSGGGIPVTPVTLAGAVHAAWLSEGDGGGTLWSSTTGEAVPLDYAGADIGDGLDPVFVGNGSRLALNERQSGWVWTVPDGQLVPSSQAWDLEEPTEVEQQNDVEAERVLDPKPPVAVDDAFGVRAGSVAVLPVLLNDHDPNEDVLSIDPASLESVDPAFGTVSIAGAQQQFVLNVADDATGSATLRYRTTDGTTTDGLLSGTATVTITVVSPSQNSAPVWCGVEGCLATWPSPTVAPGATVSVDVLDGWVDPEGDPIYLAGAANDAAAGGTVTTTPGGTVTYQHPDPNAADAVTVTLGLTVSDAFGATADRPLTIGVTPTPDLTAESFAVVGVVGEPVAVDLAPYVTGATGALILSKAVALDEARSSVTTNATGLSMLFSATEAGSYLVQYTVRDDRGEVSATVRVTMSPADAATISTPPLTAFVRPNEDATVDVFPAVANPAGLVLLVSDIRPRSDPLASLSVDLVGQSMLRVSGSTDDGQPGRLGVVRYTVSDGTGSPTASAHGELTVILLPSPAADPPIAVDDAVTVRAGAQIDIPVLSNDSAPSGALIAVDPSLIVNENSAGLAFATSRLVRYLAPTAPGTYGIGYTIFRLGFPEVVDTARVIVTVVGDESNQAPVPHTLEGRVLSGETVRIPFTSFEVDPDGDTVTLDRITSQPADGSATIAPEGDAIVYTSPAEFSGQVRFGYQVRDSQGATGAAEVRVGVLDGQSDPSPVTYSDYIQIQAGATAEAVVRPGDNDVNPGGGELELVAVEPNAPPDSDEFTALQARLGAIDDGQVTLRAGEELGTFSYSYTVRNDSGDTAIGLIVVKVVRGPVPDFPIVRDTALTIETREEFPRGVDVLTGKVSWNAGDVSGLELSLWGSHPGIEVDGWEISGQIPDETLLIPFEVTGTAFDGTEVNSYGFLRVPGDRDVRLSLRTAMSSLDVKEKESVELDLAEAVAMPSGQAIDVDGGGVRAGGARPEASCTLVSGTTIRYSAGAGAPWTDSCVVPVKLQIQDQYTFLTVHIDVEAEIPQPVLRSASVAVSPGATIEYDLRGMVDWAGKEDWDAVQYATTYRGDQFVVSQSGSLVSVTAKDASRPGREEPVTVTLPSHPDAPAASLIVTVGPAPSTLPKGGTAVQRCSQSGGTTSCTISVIGMSGEINPLPGTPLTLVSAEGPANCAGVSFTRASDTAVRASWATEAAGAADCTGSFVVQDAQGRQSSGDRNGQVILDLHGLPAAPTRLDWTGFTATTVTLRVISASSSYPGVEGYRITAGGRVVATCAASGECPPIDAPTGERIAYEARAFNSVGDSRSSVGTTAWAYRAPAAPAGAEFTPTPNGSTGGVATITVTGVDPSSGFVRLAGGTGGEVTEPVRGSTVTFRDYVIGSNSPTTLTATALTRFELPPIPGGTPTGGTHSFQAYGIGAPRLELTVAASTTGDPGSITATARVTANGVGERILVGFTDGRGCRPSEAIDARGATVTHVFENRDLWLPVTVTACAVTERGDRFGTTEASQTATPIAGIDQPTGRATYTVEGGFSRNGSQYTWDRLTGIPDLDASRLFEVRYRAGGVETTDFRSLFALGANPGPIEAFSCHNLFGCSAPGVAVTPTGPAYTARVTFPTSCRSDQPAPGATVLANPADYTVAVTSTPADAAGVVTHTYTVTWRGALTGLASLTTESGAYALACEPPPPAPAPVPVPPPVTVPVPPPTTP
ncbi:MULTISPECIES: Ig-like domain-containing protein [unclassified Microbacterium]|uniref:Ig-like domain-containing protein n=1 Tax=unclassified Microbacterium TaxID=2609290 RepID=UPI00214C02BB|nr:MULTISPECIES: Ig-like domain-containing protein [unclassified Microbacterium]MCR2784274.1 Ig-like domain-containing protein [Microbacterium sp. zg.B96]WIM14897.1 Ig-like domain-containing protein [Microbacterium sp. zg-B96]